MTIIIPAYKPDEKFLALLKELRKSFSGAILAVDDGGKEEYRSFFETAKTEYGCTVLTHPENRGKGAALKTAFAYLADHAEEGETFVTADADGQHLPKDIFACLEEARLHPDSLVLGGRSFKGNVPARSRFGNFVSRHTFRFLMGQKVRDTQTGLRAFSSSLLPFLLSVPGDRYEYEMRMLCLACKEKIPIREITIETVYLEENKSSHFNPVRDALRVYKILFQNAVSLPFQILSFLLSSLFSWGVDTLAAFLFHFFLSRIPSLDDFQLRVLSTVPARIISSVINFLINRKVVFRSVESKRKTALFFFATVVVVLGATIGITTLWEEFVFRPLLAPHESLAYTISYVLAQVICFPVSFLLQKYVVFPKRDAKKRS